MNENASHPPLDPAHRSAERLIRIGAVAARIGLSRATIYRMVEAGKFPAPVRITSRCIAWPESAVNDWVSVRLKGGEL